MRLTRITRTVGALALVSGLLAACSSSSSSSKTSATSAPANAGPAVKLGLLWQIKGEGPYGQDDYQNGAMLAIDQINAAGGLNGKNVTSFRKPVDPLDNQKTISSFLSAVDQKPTAMIGLVAPTQVQAVSAKITSNAIPLVATVTSDPFDAYGAASGSGYLWFVGPYNPAMATFGTNYLVKDLKLSKIGLMGTNEAYGTEGVTAAEAALTDAGLKPFAKAPYSPSATDLTREVLAMKGADAVIDWGYPTTVAVQLNQFLQNGIKIPTMSSTAVDTTVASSLAKGEALADVYASQPCDLASPDYSKTLSAFVSAFKAKYGYLPSQNAAWSYDAVNVVVAAVKMAGSTSPSAVNTALGKVSVPGACSTTYQADAAHFMAHSAIISKFDTKGNTTVMKMDTIPNQPAG